MLARLQFWVDLAYFVFHVWPALVRYVRGGFHCWRDAPLWVVREYVELGEDDPQFADLYRQACDELRLRTRGSP